MAEEKIGTWYEEEIEKIVEETREKREFGLRKYGLESFQGSLEKLEACDVIEHMEQELIDTINYSMAQLVKLRLFKKTIGDKTVIWDPETKRYVEKQ